MPESLRWYVARTRASAEHWAYVNLVRVGYEVYLPLCTVRRRDRVLRSLIHTVRVPLFRNYIFVQHTPGESWRPIRSAPGVQTLICSGHEIQYAAVGAVEALQATDHLRQSVPAPKHRYRSGDACRLTAGPLRGQDAVIDEIVGDNAVVTVLMLGELRRVAVPLESLGLRAD